MAPRWFYLACYSIAGAGCGAVAGAFVGAFFVLFTAFAWGIMALLVDGLSKPTFHLCLVAVAWCAIAGATIGALTGPRCRR